MESGFRTKISLTGLSGSGDERDLEGEFETSFSAELDHSDSSGKEEDEGGSGEEVADEETEEEAELGEDSDEDSEENTSSGFEEVFGDNHLQDILDEDKREEKSVGRTKSIIAGALVVFMHMMVSSLLYMALGWSPQV